MDTNNDIKLKLETLELFIRVWRDLALVKLDSQGMLEEVQRYLDRLDELMLERFKDEENIVKMKREDILNTLNDIFDILDKEFPDLNEKLNEAYKEAFKELIDKLWENYQN
jgi:hypothetical protein